MNERRTLYHYTSPKNIESILNHGLLKSMSAFWRGRGGCVYLLDEIPHDKDDMAVLQVNTDGLNVTRISDWELICWDDIPSDKLSVVEWATELVVCGKCGEKHQAVYSLPTKFPVECPYCGKMVCLMKEGGDDIDVAVVSALEELRSNFNDYINQMYVKNDDVRYGYQDSRERLGIEVESIIARHFAKWEADNEADLTIAHMKATADERDRQTELITRLTETVTKQRERITELESRDVTERHDRFEEDGDD